MSETEKLAALLAQTVASQVIGAAASELIANPLLSALDISDTSQQKFQEGVLAQLDRIRDQLKEVQASLYKITTAVDALQASFNAYAISAALAGYYTSANKIHSRYMLFIDNLAALTDPNADHAHAVADLYVRLSPPSDLAISDAMDEIHAFVVPSPGVKGVFDHILTGMRDAMLVWAQNAENYKIQLGGSPEYWIPSEGGVFSTRRMLTGSFAVARTYIENFVVPLMKHVLATEIKGLMLLTRAWAGGSHDNRVGVYVDNILGHIQLMKEFFANRVVPSARDLAAANLEMYGKRLVGETLKRAPWHQLPVDATGPHRELVPTAPFLMNDDWVMWERYPDFDAHFRDGLPLPPPEDEYKWGREVVCVHRPWEGWRRPAYVLAWSGAWSGASTELINQAWQTNPRVGDYYTILPPISFLNHRDEVKFLSERLGEIDIEPSGQLGVTVDSFSDIPPAALADMLKKLPAKRDELKP
jgi:hypothetical protein